MESLLGCLQGFRAHVNKWALRLRCCVLTLVIMAAAKEGEDRNIGDDDNVPPRPQPNPIELDAAALQAPLAEDPALNWLSNLPEAKRSVAESVIWPEVFCG